MKKTKKFTKIALASSLALFMGIGTLCGVLLAPINLLHAGATSTSNAGDPAASAQSPDRAQFTAEQMNFDPEKDEIIYVTENGTEIKQHNIAASGNYTSLQYFTLGTYNNKAVNWIILAFNGSNFMESATPAGAAIKNDTAKQVLLAQSNTSLGQNQLLCISQYAMGSGTYDASATPHGSVSYSASQCSSNRGLYSASTDQFTDYYASFSETNTLAQGWTDLVSALNLSAYHGNKIVVNSNFNSSYVFYFNSSQYASFVGSTGYKIPYKIDATSTATWCYYGNATPVKAVHSATYEYVNSNYFHWAAGSGHASVKISAINSSGDVADFTAMNLYGSITGTNSGSGYYDGYRLGYSISDEGALTVGYRPAMVVDFSKL